MHDAVEDAGARPDRARPERRHHQGSGGADWFRGRDLGRGGTAGVRSGRADRLPADAARRRAAALDRGRVEDSQVLPSDPTEGRAARRRNLAVRRRSAFRRCHRHRHLAHEPRDRGRLRQSHHHGRGRHHQSRHHRRRLGRGLLLRARPVEPARLHGGRQPRHELGRRALLEIRRDDEQRARPEDRAHGRRDRRDRRPVSRFRRL